MWYLTPGGVAVLAQKDIIFNSVFLISLIVTSYEAITFQMQEHFTSVLPYCNDYTIANDSTNGHCL